MEWLGVPGLDEALVRSIPAALGCAKIELTISRFGDQFGIDVLSCQYGTGLEFEGRTPVDVLRRLIESDAKRNGPGGLAAQLTDRFGRPVIVFSTHPSGVTFSLEDAGRLLLVVAQSGFVHVTARERHYKFHYGGGITALSREALEDLLETMRTIDAATNGLALREPSLFFFIEPDRKTVTFTADLTGAPVEFVTFHERQVQLPDDGRRVDFRLSLDDGDLQQVPPKPARRDKRSHKP